MSHIKQKVIVIDGLSALQGGGQTYLRNLLEYYDSVQHNDVRVMAIIPISHTAFLNVNSTVELLTPTFPAKSIFHRTLWYRFKLPSLLRSLKADVLFCPGGFISSFAVPGCKTVATFQNMLPFSPTERHRYDLGYIRARLFLLRFIQAASFRKADLVIFISEYAKSIIDLMAGKRKGKSIVIPHGLSEHFSTPQDHPSATFQDEPYVLYVSILNVYKAQLEVIKAWSLLRGRRDTKEKLVLVGPEYAPYSRKVHALISELGLQDEVILAGNVPYNELPAWYQHAKVNLFASSCENCPNILLEALAGGRPILCSDYQPMPEFAGDAVRYFDPYNPEQLADELTQLLDDTELQNDLSARARERAKLFDWQDTATKTWDALAALARSN